MLGLKTKNPPPLPEATTAPAQEVKPFDIERMLKIKPEIDQRLDAFIKNNPKLNDAYTGIVVEHPEHAVRKLMLNKMFRYEAEMQQTNRLAPQAREWLQQQTPDVQQRINERIERYSPMYRESAAVRIIAQEKAKLDFTKLTPAPGQSQAVGQRISP